MERNDEIYNPDLSTLETGVSEDQGIQQIIIDDFDLVKLESGEGLKSKKMDRDDFLKAIAIGEIGDSHINRFIKTIESPTQILTQIKKEAGNKNVEKLSIAPYQKIESDLNCNAGLRILFNLIRNAPPETKISVEDIIDFLAAYNTPQKFDNLIARISKPLSDEQYHDLQLHAGKIGSMFFGIQYKYWEQWKLLKAEATFIYINEHPKNTQSVEELTEGEKESIKSKIEIHGDEWNGRHLSVNDIYENGLEPNYKIQFEGKNFFFSSKTFLIHNKRLAIIGYVEIGGALVARSYYLSGSHNIWKYLPRYQRWYKDEVAWFDKGYNEQSISIPFPIQQALAKISGENTTPIQLDNADFFLAGTAREIPLINPDEQHITYKSEISEKPEQLPGNFHSKNGAHLLPPKELKFADKGANINYDDMTGTWIQFSPTYGNVLVETYKSHNRKYEYMFCTDTNGRVWISAVDNDSSIGSTGLRQNWIDAGCLTTPAFSYEEESDDYGNPALRNGHYIDMYQNYLRHIPIIQEYIKHKKTAKPK